MMTSEASDLPDWKDQTPWCSATVVDNSISPELLSTASCPAAWRRDDHSCLAQVQNKSWNKAESRLRGREEFGRHHGQSSTEFPG